MSILFFTDPHLGLNRSSHTTPASRKRLQDKMFEAATAVFEHPAVNYVCLGDLFDKAQNDEATIKQGSAIAKNCSIVLAGNHDLLNREGKVSSLGLLEAFEHNIVSAGVTGEWGFSRHRLVGTNITAIPHVATQELFDKSLKAAWEEGEGGVLLLHCNYNSGYAENEASLNLTREQAAKLVEVYDYVLIGHEHVSREDFDGKLVLLGNLHPTSFSDISDKYVWKLDSGKLEKIQVYDASKAVGLTWDLLIGGQQDLTDCDFIDVFGDAPADKAPAISKAVANLWKTSNAYMIRNRVAYDTVSSAMADVQGLQDLPSRISADLKGTPLEGVWLEYLQRFAA